MKKRQLSKVEKGVLLLILVLLGMAIFVAIKSSVEEFRMQREQEAEELVLLIESADDFFDDNGEHYPAIAALTDGNYYLIGSSVVDCNLNCESQDTQSTCVDLSGLQGAEFADVTNYYLMKGAENELTLGSCTSEFELSSSL